MALQLQPPITVDGATHYGWDADVKAFVFDRFRISLNGKIESSEPAVWLGENRPTADVPLPADVPAEGLRELLVGCRHFPVLVALIAAEVLAPLHGKKLPPLLTYSDNSPAFMTKLASLIGFEIGASNSIAACGRILDLYLHRIERPWLGAYVTCLPSPPPEGSPARAALCSVVPLFLSHLAGERRMQLPQSRGSFRYTVLEAVSTWLADLPGAQGVQFNLFGLDRYWRDPSPDDPAGRAAHNFAAVLHELLHGKRISTATKLARPLETQAAVIKYDDRYELHWRFVAAIIARRSKVPVNWQRLKFLLAEAGAVTDARALTEICFAVSLGLAYQARLVGQQRHEEKNAKGAAAAEGRPEHCTGR